MRVLITAGGTREPIDRVRFLTNLSSGKTGVAIAEAFEVAGHEAVVIRAETSVAALDKACRVALSQEHFDLMVHSAAVSDFVVEAVTVDGVRHAVPLSGKLSSQSRLCVELRPGIKILPRLKGYSKNPGMTLVGFKLTDGASEAQLEAAVQRVLGSGADLVVQNDLQTMHHVRARLWDARGIVATCPTLPDLCACLVRYAEGR